MGLGCSRALGREQQRYGTPERMPNLWSGTLLNNACPNSASNPGRCYVYRTILGLASESYISPGSPGCRQVCQYTLCPPFENPLSKPLNTGM